jgi:PPOX class probable F420-dependent enzyme
MAPGPPTFGAPRGTRGAPLQLTVEAPAWALAMLREGRVGRLGSVDSAGQPLVVPVCYVFDGRVCYSAIDAKPKRVPGRTLARIRNIEANPRVSLTVDHYDEEWARLRYVIVQGRAELVSNGTELARSIDLLREKYPQYRAMGLGGDSALVIRIDPRRIVAWRFTEE